DQVTLFELTDCSTGIVPLEKYEDLRVVPNPTLGVARIELATTGPASYILLDERGLLIGGGVLPESRLLDLGPLPRGIYTLDFPALRKRARVVKEGSMFSGFP